MEYKRQQFFNGKNGFIINQSELRKIYPKNDEQDSKDVKKYTSKINRECSKSGDWRKAEKLLQEMKVNGIKPNVCTYNVIIKTYNTAGINVLHRTEEILTRMQIEDNIVPDIISYHTVIDAYCCYGLIQEAYRVLRKYSSNFTPNLRTYSILLKGHARTNSPCPDRAIDLLRQMRYAGLTPDIVTLNTVSDVCCNVGDIQSALRVFDMYPTIKLNIRSYSILLKGISRMKDPQPEKALEILNFMKSNGCQPDIIALNTVLKVLIDDGNINQILSFYYSIQMCYNTTPNKTTHMIVLQALILNREFNEAEILIKKHKKNNNFIINSIFLEKVIKLFMNKCDSISISIIIERFYSLVGVSASIEMFHQWLECIRKMNQPLEAWRIIKSVMSNHGVTPVQLTFDILFDIVSNCHDPNCDVTKLLPQIMNEMEIRNCTFVKIKTFSILTTNILNEIMISTDDNECTYYNMCNINQVKRFIQSTVNNGNISNSSFLNIKCLKKFLWLLSSSNNNPILLVDGVSSNLVNNCNNIINNGENNLLLSLSSKTLFNDIGTNTAAIKNDEEDMTCSYDVSSGRSNTSSSSTSTSSSRIWLDNFPDMKYPLASDLSDTSLCSYYTSGSSSSNISSSSSGVINFYDYRNVKNKNGTTY